MKWAVGVIVVALALGLGLLWLFAFPGAPPGYHWPRHTMWGEGPAGLISGELSERNGCFYVTSAPNEPDLVIWPMFASVSVDAEGPVIRIEGRSFRLGEQIQLGGGEYTDQLPEPAAGAADVPCEGPYWLATGLGE